MIEVEKQAKALLAENNNFIKSKSPVPKDPAVIYKVAECFLSNSFIYMILNRWHRKKIKYETTRFLDDAIKNINYFFITWDKVVDKADIYTSENKSLKHSIKSQEIIKNFYNLGMAIDQLLFLVENSKNYWQVVSYKKKSLALTFSLSDMTHVYVQTDPEHEDSGFYKNFIDILKVEILETVDLEWKRLSANTHKQRSPVEVNDLITFTQYCEKIMFHFMENTAADILKKQIKNFKKYVEKMEKYKKH